MEKVQHTIEFYTIPVDDRPFTEDVDALVKTVRASILQYERPLDTGHRCPLTSSSLC